jgi:hypothetical protein
MITKVTRTGNNNRPAPSRKAEICAIPPDDAAVATGPAAELVFELVSEIAALATPSVVTSETELKERVLPKNDEEDEEDDDGRVEEPLPETLPELLAELVAVADTEVRPDLLLPLRLGLAAAPPRSDFCHLIWNGTS